MITKRYLRVLFTALLVVVFITTAAGCNKNNSSTTQPTEDNSTYTYNIYTAVSPSNWNVLTYQDNNDTQIMNYLASDFFTFDYKYDAQGKIIDGQFDVEYSAATKLEDVTASYVGDEWGIPADAKNRAYKITLRNDLKWDDGTPIKAGEFVYTMKEQLDPLAQHYRADSYYVGATIIHNAENYAKQGQKIFVSNGDAADTVKNPISSLVNKDGVYELSNGHPIKFTLKDPLDYLDGDTVEKYKNYLDQTAYAALAALADADGRIDVTDATIALWTTLISTDDWGNEAPDLVPVYMVFEKEYEQIDFSKVGLFAPDDYTLVLILDKELPLLNEDGSLSYKAAYNMNNLPLVKQDIFEATKVAPKTADGLWTSTYNSNVLTSASWGPYKLTKFQAGKEYQLEKNTQWFGFSDEQYKGQYQTTIIHGETIKEWSTAWLKFQAGEIDDIAIDVSIANDYKSSERAYYTPTDFVGSLQLQSNKDALKGREEAGINKTLLTYTDFRKALSLSINRSSFATSTTTSSLAGFGLFNSMHYYDVATGGVYRNTDVARQVLLDIYNVDAANYDSLEEAEKAITGFDLVEARRLLTKAYNEAIANGDLKATDTVKLIMGSGAKTEAVLRRFDFLQKAWTELAKTTPLEGKLVFDLIEKGSTWSKDFRDGAYDICMGGWTGAAWDPGYFLLAYLSPSYMYSKAWNTNSVMLEFTMPGVGEGGADVTDTLSLLQWYDVLNGKDGAKYNWGSGSIPEEKRLLLIAALEKEVLKVYYTVPLYNEFTASLLSFKQEFKSYEYNTFMGYGGIRYMTYNYNDVEWAKLVDEQNGQLNYKG